MNPIAGGKRGAARVACAQQRDGGVLVPHVDVKRVRARLQAETCSLLLSKPAMPAFNEAAFPPPVLSRRKKKRFQPRETCGFFASGDTGP